MLQTTNYENSRVYYQAGGVVPDSVLDADYDLYTQFSDFIDSEKERLNDAGSGDMSMQVRISPSVPGRLLSTRSAEHQF